MIPTMILVGLVPGLIPEQWIHRASAIAALVLTSVTFGLAVDQALVGTVLALVNAIVGVLLGVGMQTIGRAVLRVSSRARTPRLG